MRKKIIIGIVILGLLAACGGGVYFFMFARQSENALGTLTTAQVKRGDLAVYVRGSGALRAKTSRLLKFDPQIHFKQVYVRTGDTVRRDQVLAEIDTLRLELALAQAQTTFNQQQLNLAAVQAGPDAAELDAARAALTLAQANYDLALQKADLKNDQIIVARTGLDKAALALQKAQAAYDRAVVEHAGNQTELAEALTQAKLDYSAAQANYRLQLAALDDTNVASASAALASAKASLAKLENSPTPRELAAAQAQLEQARLVLAQAQLDLRNAQIVAPFDGTIIQINLEGFETTGGAEIQSIEIADLGNLQAVVSIPEVDIVQVRVGQPVKLDFDVMADKTFAGQVEQIGLSGVAEQGVTSYPVIIALQDAEPQLRLNMAANVSILVDARKNILLVPNRAIQRREGKTIAELKTETGKHEVEVTLGIQGEGQSEVLSGLKEGDTIILPPLNVPLETGF
ncbi:MAG: efflux RND transporter periplasmic adaptor subunit [Chloroflexi bacterium]|nr:efflux RND transporter periplasmic adaptor subunit [Chloroflexota bacterium]